MVVVKMDMSQLSQQLFHNMGFCPLFHGLKGPILRDSNDWSDLRPRLGTSPSSSPGAEAASFERVKDHTILTMSGRVEPKKTQKKTGHQGVFS